MDGTSYTVSQVARMSFVTVRTLHHYHEIGLLVPSRRTASGYRLYCDADLRRLQQILLFRELGFSLEAVQRLLDDPAFDRRSALRAQREVLRSQVRRTEAVIRAVEATLDSLEGGREMETNELFDGFDEFRNAEYAREAEERWGETEAYKESMRRTRGYTKQDWGRLKEEGSELMRRLLAAKAAGRRPEEAEVMALAEEHREQIDRWFYPCSHEIHVGLAEMYVGDPRFREFYEKQGEGLTDFLAAAIRANAARAAS